MNKQDYDKIWDFLKERRSNITEINNIQKILWELTGYGDYPMENCEFDEDEVIRYITQPHHDLSYNEYPNIEQIIEDMIEDGIIKEQIK